MLGFRRKAARDGANLKKKSDPGTIDQVLSRLWWGQPTKSRVVVNDSVALAIPAIMAACRLISETAASAPINLLDETPSEDGQRVAARAILRHHWAAKIIDRPNEWQTSYEFFEWLFFTTALRGKALAVKNIVDGELRELIPVRNGWHYADLNDPTGDIIVMTAKENQYLRFPRAHCLILSGPSLDSISALSPVVQFREMIGLSHALEAQQAAVSGSGGRPSGIMKAPPATTDVAISNMAGDMARSFGIGGEGGVAVLPGDWSYVPIGFSSVDQQLIESRKFQIEEVARAYRVPAYMLDSGDGKSYASSDVATRVFIQHSIRPWLIRLEQALTRDLLWMSDATDVERLRFDCAEELLLRGSPNEQADFYTKMLGAGGTQAIFTPNEVRNVFGAVEIQEKWANEVSRGAMDKIAIAEATRGDPVADEKDGLQLPEDEETNPDA